MISVNELERVDDLLGYMINIIRASQDFKPAWVTLVSHSQTTFLYWGGKKPQKKRKKQSG